MGPCPDTCGWRRTCPPKAGSVPPARRCASHRQDSARSRAWPYRMSQPFGVSRRPRSNPAVGFRSPALRIRDGDGWFAIHFVATEFGEGLLVRLGSGPISRGARDPPRPAKSNRPGDHTRPEQATGRWFARVTLRRERRNMTSRLPLSSAQPPTRRQPTPRASRSPRTPGRKMKLSQATAGQPVARILNVWPINCLDKTCGGAFNVNATGFDPSAPIAGSGQVLALPSNPNLTGATRLVLASGCATVRKMLGRRLSARQVLCPCRNGIFPPSGTWGSAVLRDLKRPEMLDSCRRLCASRSGAVRCPAGLAPASLRAEQAHRAVASTVRNCPTATEGQGRSTGESPATSARDGNTEGVSNRLFPWEEIGPMSQHPPIEDSRR